MLKIIPYKIGSESAKALARALGVKRIIPEGGYIPATETVVLNWGNSTPHFHHSKMLNKPEGVRIAANKLSALTKLKQAGIPVPDFTTDAAVAEAWLRNNYRVIVRHKLSSHSGEGIEVIRPEQGRVPYAPLYTKYTKKDQEFRVHVFNGRVIDLTEKRRRSSTGVTVTNNLIRNHANGWVFCRDNVYCPEFVKETSVRAVQALGLDFGALDVIVRGDKCWILEVNTAPGLEGTTLQRYVEALRPYAGYGRQRNRYQYSW